MGTTPGRSNPKRDAMGTGLAALNKLAGSQVIDRLGLRKQAERTVYEASRTGFKVVGKANRAFARVPGRGKPARPGKPSGGDLFDLTPSDEQKMIIEATSEFARELLRPAAAEADAACATTDKVLARANEELGLTGLTVPESLGGMSHERSTTTGVLVAEALAHGDMGQTVALLAPGAVATALVLWGDADQQATYLPSFVGDSVPAAALAVLGPHVLFDPLALKTTATRTPSGYVLRGVKSLVPRAADAELFIIGAMLEDTPTLFLVESGEKGVTIESEPAMGLRAAGMGRVILEGVKVPRAARLGEAAHYREAIRLSRLGWSALALGTGKAVLDYVVPYVNERKAFGEPISHRQAVAFKVADIATELEGARLVTLKAAGRAERGREFAREVALARKLTSEYGMRIGSDGVQLLGGHGYVKEHPVERWYRDLRAAGVMEGVVLV